MSHPARAIATVDVGGLPAVLADGLSLDAAAGPAPSLVVVELDEGADDATLASAVAVARFSALPMVGVGRGPLGQRFGDLGAVLTTTLVAEDAESARWQAGVVDVDGALAQIAATAEWSPRATHTLAGLLRLTAILPVTEGLAAESLAYSMLLSGPEFRRWLDDREFRPVPEPSTPPVLLERDGDLLAVTLNRPERHNAFGQQVREGLADAFDLVATDPSITAVILAGAGRSFCSGGDLDEFGNSADVTLAHLIRVDRSVAARLDRVRDRVTVVLHGACIGAGIELASYAGQVNAMPDATIVLPELAMGLIPGAGGTVGMTRRVGRWRTAYLALTGRPLPLATALRWGLVDEISR